MQDPSRILIRNHLNKSRSNLHFPEIPNSSRQICLVKQEQFWPTLKTKKYNLLKLHELKHHRDRDRRMGRLSVEKDRLAKLKQQEEQLHLNSIAYYVRRNDWNRKVRNSSFMNLNEKLKEKNRYYSIQR